MSYSSQTKEAAVARYQAGESSFRIAYDIGCVPASVLHWIRDAGCQVRHGGLDAGRKHQCRNCDEIVASYTSGQETTRSLAEQYGVGISTIQARLRQHGVVFSGPGSEHACGTRCPAILAGYRLGRTLRQLGKQEGLSYERVRQLLARHGAARRSHSRGRLSIVAVAEALGRAGTSANGAVGAIRAIVPVEWQPVFDLVLREGTA